MALEYPRPFGKYTLLRPLARGGMGEIHLAAAGEVGGFEKLCVIKKVLAEHADESKANRFLDEAKVVIRLSHTNLVSVFDVGKAEGEFYLAMEFVEGHDLGAVWNKCAEKKARFPVDIALYLVREVCRGLAYAHTYGGLSLVHRDVTPPNIMISYFGEVKLTDFGLARSRLKQEFTAPGVVYGRLAYLAPEQARGTTVDARTDLYALGIILWELLTGTQLFRVSAADPVTAISVVRNPQIDPPSKRVPRLPQSLDELVMKALAVSPNDRFQTAEDFRRAVGVELAAIAPTIDAERVAGFMRMLYGEEIERERQARDRLLGRDRSGLVHMEPPTDPQTPSKHAAPAPAASSGEGDARTRRKGPRTRTVPPSLVEVTPAAPRAARKAPEEPVAPTVRIASGGRPPAAAPAAAQEAPAAAPARPAAKGTGGRHSATPVVGEGVEAPNRVGQVIDGRYRLKAVLGAGAMGAVYDAEHVEIGRRVAMKILHPQYSRNEDLVARFRREARAASTIGHPHIVDVTDFGSTEDGCAYFVMERLEGRDLKDLLLRDHTLALPRAIAITLQVCQAVQAAHEHGIIHRDLKPENIFLVARDGNPDFVKILDFGIAKSVDPDEADGRSLTLPGIAMGTPVYMAPEQATGSAIDVRSDVYAVGAILYEMLTGEPPIDGDDVLDVLTRKAMEDPRPPSQLNAAIPAALEQVIMRALVREPPLRTQSMVELEQELRETLRDPAPPEALLGMMMGASGERSAVPVRGQVAGDDDLTLVQPNPAAQRGAAGERRGARSTAEVRPLAEQSRPPRRRGPGTFWPVAAMLVLGMVAGLYFGLPAVLRSRRAPVVPPRVSTGKVATPAALATDAGSPSPPRDAAAPRPGHPVAAVPGAGRDAGPPPAGGDAAPAAVDAGPHRAPRDGAVATPPARPTLSRAEVAGLLHAARQAAAAGRYTVPAGNCVRDLLARLEEARPGHREAAALRARLVRGLLKDGEAQLRKRHFDEAEVAFRGVYGLAPHDGRGKSGLIRALIGRAALELKKKRYDAATTDARDAVVLGDTSSRGHLLLGEALMKKHAYADAVVAFRRAVELRPKSREARRGLARAQKAVAAERAVKAPGKGKRGKEPAGRGRRGRR